MTLPVLTPDLVEAFILVLIRVSAIIMMLPVFGDAVIPSRVKWGLSFLIALLLFPAARNGMAPMGNMELMPLVLKLAGEIIIGASIGFAARCIFAGIQLAGELTGMQMGFSLASVIDPSSNLQVSIVAEFKYMLSLLLFVSVNAHHIFIDAIAESFRIVTPLAAGQAGALLPAMIRLTGEIFVIAVKISAPVMAVLLFTNVALGIVARTVPQMNVFIVSFPLSIAVGLLFLGLTLPLFAQLVQRLFFGLPGKLGLLLKILGSG